VGQALFSIANGSGDAGTVAAAVCGTVGAGLLVGKATIDGTARGTAILDCIRDAVGRSVVTVEMDAGVAAVSILTAPGCDGWADRQPEMNSSNVMAKRKGVFMIPLFLRSAMPGGPQSAVPVFPSDAPQPPVR